MTIRIVCSYLVFGIVITLVFYGLARSIRARSVMETGPTELMLAGILNVFIWPLNLFRAVRQIHKESKGNDPT